MTKTYLIAVFALAACGDDPVNYSAPVGIELKVKSGEVTSSNTLTPEKSITTESGNPYGGFVDEARKTLGRDPGNIVLEEVTMTLGAQSSNVANLEQVMMGNVAVQFLTNDSNNTYVVGTFANPTGLGPVAGDPDFEMAA